MQLRKKCEEKGGESGSSMVHTLKKIDLLFLSIAPLLQLGVYSRIVLRMAKLWLKIMNCLTKKGVKFKHKPLC